MHGWEGSRRKSGCGLCRLDACLRRTQTQEWAMFVQVWCTHDKDSYAGVGEVCVRLTQAWEWFRRKSGCGLCRFDAFRRRIQTQEWTRFVRIWCLYKKDSVAGVGEVCAGLMRVWEGFRRRSGRGLCRFDARMIRIQTQEWVRFVQVWCKHEMDSDAGVSEVCAGLMQALDGFRRRSGWCLCICGARMRKIQTQEWVSFVQVWCTHDRDSGAGVSEVCANLMLV